MFLLPADSPDPGDGIQRHHKDEVLMAIEAWYGCFMCAAAAATFRCSFLQDKGWREYASVTRLTGLGQEQRWDFQKNLLTTPAAATGCGLTFFSALRSPGNEHCPISQGRLSVFTVDSLRLLRIARRTCMSANIWCILNIYLSFNIFLEYVE
jgi:hypothetical protein